MPTVPLEQADWETSNAEDFKDKFPVCMGQAVYTPTTMVRNPNKDCVLCLEQITITRQTTRQDSFLIVRVEVQKETTRCNNTKMLDITMATNSNINLRDHIEEA